MRSIESIIMMCSAAAGAASLFLLIFAWRGRRIDDHPICRKCGFDLFGLPSSSARCPECGRDITRRRAVRIGHRRTRRALLALAILSVLPAAGILGIATVARTRGIDWHRYMPVSWLIRQTTFPDARDAAMREIMSRLAAGTLADSDVRELAGVALASQRDRSKPWFSAWGSFIENARVQGRLTRGEWHRYCRQAAGAVTLDLRDTVRTGQPIPVRLSSVGARMARTTRILVFTGPPAVEVAGASIHGYAQSADEDFDWDSPGATCEYVVEQSEEAAPALSEGERRVTLAFTIVFADARGQEEVTVRTQRTLRVISDDRPLVRPVGDPGEGEVVRSNIAVSIAPDPLRQSATVFIDSRGGPYDVSCSGKLRIGPTEFDLGFILLPAGRPRQIEIPMPGVLQFLDPRSADVVLEPDARAAEYTVGVKEFWGERIVFKDVPIARQARNKERR